MLVPWVAQQDPAEMPKLMSHEHLCRAYDLHVCRGEPGLRAHGAESVAFGLPERPRFRLAAYRP